MEILRAEGITTQYDYNASDRPRIWAINAYGDDVNPNPHIMYLDDAAISKSRLSAPTGSTSLPGDFNRDGRVDAADYTIWRSGLGGKYTPADYQIWKSNFGRTASASTNASAIPEPTTLASLLTLLSLCPRLLRRLRPR